MAIGQQGLSIITQLDGPFVGCGSGTQEIKNTLCKLRLSGLAQTLQTRVMQAQAAQEPFLDTLNSLLQDELDRRHSRLMARRYKLSGLDEKLSLANFDWRFNPKLPRGA